jgi:hypothetical protein
MRHRMWSGNSDQEAVKISIRARQIDDLPTCDSPCRQHDASGSWSLWAEYGQDYARFEA